MRALPAVLLLAGCLAQSEPPTGEGPVRVEQLGLPAVSVPADNPLTQAKVDLGRKLFMDRRLSRNRTLACGSCHVPEQGFTAHELATSVGVEGRSLRRNAPTILNVGWMQHLFHDGRESILENQAWGPMLAQEEMDNPSIGFVVDRVKSLPDYAGLFEQAFGRGPSMQTIAQALASYERTLVAGNSRFDRWRYGGEADALKPEEQRGFTLFAGKAGCAACHTVGERAALFTDQSFHNTGVGWAQTHGRRSGVRVELIPGVYAEVDDATLSTFSEREKSDLGRFEITDDPADRWAYRTPSLRNIGLSAPYMHDGSLATLEEVVEFYDRGGIDNPLKDERLKPLHLSPEEKSSLVAFLKALDSDDVVARYAAEARAVAHE